MCISWKVAQLPQSERGATHHLQHNISWIQVMEVYHETELLFGLGWAWPFQAILPNGAFFQARNSGASLTERVKPLVKFTYRHTLWQLVEHGRKTCVFSWCLSTKLGSFPCDFFLRLGGSESEWEESKKLLPGNRFRHWVWSKKLSFSPAMKVQNDVFIGKITSDLHLIPETQRTCCVERFVHIIFPPCSNRSTKLSFHHRNCPKA